MKFSVIIAFVAAATVVSAEVNGFRFARGMDPATPAKRGTKSGSAHGNKPSNTPGKTSQCNTGSTKCCNYVGKQGDSTIDGALGLLSTVIPADAIVGLGCSVVSVTSCTQQPVCCNHVSQDGLINWGCAGISL